MTINTFSKLKLSERLLRNLQSAGYSAPTHIQSKAIPALLEGKDLLGISQTGSGKTAAFTLPILHHLSTEGKTPRKRSADALILSPTRELAMQISHSIDQYGKGLGLRHCVVIGGASQQAQARDLANGVHVVVATPGRLLDLVERNQVDLRHVRYLVLDEADRMLDMGFIRDVRKLISLVPRRRQTAFFSATMPKEVAKLSSEILYNPIRIEIKPKANATPKIDQQLYHVSVNAKQELLHTLLQDNQLYRVVVFTRTKRGAERVAKKLRSSGESVDSIHGNKSQPARKRALENFRRGRLRLIVATDVMARGIDVDDVTHVVNFDMPGDPDSYIHRIGRTARAGKAGTAISFCDPSESKQLRDIEKTIKGTIPVLGGLVQPVEQATAETRGRPPARRHNRPKRNTKAAQSVQMA